MCCVNHRHKKFIVHPFPYVMPIAEFINLIRMIIIRLAISNIFYLKHTYSKQSVLHVALLNPCVKLSSSDIAE